MPTMIRRAPADLGPTGAAPRRWPLAAPPPAEAVARRSAPGRLSRARPQHRPRPRSNARRERIKCYLQRARAGLIVSRPLTVTLDSGDASRRPAANGTGPPVGSGRVGCRRGAGRLSLCVWRNGARTTALPEFRPAFREPRRTCREWPSGAPHRRLIRRLASACAGEIPNVTPARGSFAALVRGALSRRALVRSRPAWPRRPAASAECRAPTANRRAPSANRRPPAAD